MREEILSKIRDNQVIVLVGETGCGKTTQVTVYLYPNAVICWLYLEVLVFEICIPVCFSQYSIHYTKLYTSTHYTDHIC